VRTRKIQSGLVQGVVFLILSMWLSRGVHAQCMQSCGSSSTYLPSSFVTLYTSNGKPDIQVASPFPGTGSIGHLIFDGLGNLYGATATGGASNLGSIFKIDISGKETILYSFGAPPDGANPNASLVFDSAGNLYGTTSSGGSSGSGTIFKLDANGNETVLYSFTGGSDGGAPYAGLLPASSGNFFGTTTQGGTSSQGTIFKLDARGNETVLYSFAGSPDGANPQGELIQDAAGNLYGTTPNGGSLSPCFVFPQFPNPNGRPLDCGVVFAIDPTGKETIIHQFSGTPDGPEPVGSLVPDADGNLYGTTYYGGTGNCPIIAPDTHVYVGNIGCGSVYKLDPTGKFTVLYSFNGPDGLYPQAGLVRDGGGNLYGMTSQGGLSGPAPSNPYGFFTGSGTVFKLDPSGVLTVLFSFAPSPVSGQPVGTLLLDQAGNLYGTISGFDDPPNGGSVFKLTPTAPQSYTLNVVLPYGGGTVTSAPPGISCGTACSGSFPAGTAVTLTETPLAGTTFSYWGGGCATGETICTMLMGPDLSVNAYFNGTDYAISVLPSTVNLVVGQSIPVTLSVSPLNGANFTVSFSCGTLPTKVSCSINPSSVSLGAANPSVTVTIGTSTSVAVPESGPRSGPPSLFPNPLLTAAFAILLCFAARLGRWPVPRRAFLAASILVLSLGVESCGGGSSTPTGTLPGTYTITLTGNAYGLAAFSHSTTLTVNVSE